MRLFFISIFAGAMCYGQQKDQILLERFRIAKYGNPIFLPVKLGQQVHLFVLDSGASRHILDSSFDDLGPPIAKRLSSSSDNETVTVTTFRAPQASIGKLPLGRQQNVVSFDLTKLRHVIGEDFRGLLGIGFFRDKIVQIDFDSRVLDVLDRQSPNDNWGVAVPLRLFSEKEGGLARVSMNVGEVEEAFILDTGLAGGINLVSASFDRCVREGRLKITREILAATIAGDVKRRSGRIDKVVCGPFTNQALRISEGARNIVGLDYLSRFRVTIDVSGRAMYLRKGRRFDERFLDDMSGLHLVKIDGSIVVHAVDAGSPAARSGIKEKDIMLEISEQPAKTLRLAAIRRLLKSENDRVISMRIRRGEIEKSVSFRLQEVWKR